MLIPACSVVSRLWRAVSGQDESFNPPMYICILIHLCTTRWAMEEQPKHGVVRSIPVKAANSSHMLWKVSPAFYLGVQNTCTSAHRLADCPRMTQRFVVLSVLNVMVQSMISQSRLWMCVRVNFLRSVWVLQKNLSLDPRLSHNQLFRNGPLHKNWCAARRHSCTVAA